MSYDYKLKTVFKDGKTVNNTYQGLIGKLKMSDELSHGAPMSEGGTPQVQEFISMLKDIYKDKPNPIESITVYFNGNAVLGV